MKFNHIEKMLPFGYLILVILGIVKESVFYYQLGINILKYSNLMDILISPIADLTSHPIILIGFLLYIGLLYSCFTWAKKNYQTAFSKKLLGIKESELPMSQDQLAERVGSKFLSVTIVVVICFFLGIGIGNGIKVKEKIQQNKIEYNHTITFDANVQKKVYLIGNNSSNYFYLEPGNPHIKIAPVGAVKEVEFLKKRY